MEKIKWQRWAPSILRLERSGLEAWVSVHQYGTFSSTKKFHWRIMRGEQLLRAGSELMQKRAKEEAITELIKSESI